MEGNNTVDLATVRRRAVLVGGPYGAQERETSLPLGLAWPNCICSRSDADGVWGHYVRLHGRRYYYIDHCFTAGLDAHEGVMPTKDEEYPPPTPPGLHRNRKPVLLALSMMAVSIGLVLAGGALVALAVLY